MSQAKIKQENLHICASIGFKVKAEREKRLVQEKKLQKIEKLNFCISYEECEIGQVKSSNRNEKYVALKNRNKQSSQDRHAYPQKKRSLQAITLLPKKIHVQFENFNPRKKSLREELMTTTKTIDYKNLISSSKSKYFEKVQKQIQKKAQKCKNSSSFGLNIKSVEQISDQYAEARRFTLYQPGIKKKPSFQRQNKQISFKRVLKKNSFLKNTSQILTYKTSFQEQNLKVKKERKQTSKDNWNKQQPRTLKNKIKNMISSMDIILNSYVCSLRENLKQSDTGVKNKYKYSYYVGKGNNKNLIISILKKRWWWAQAEDINSANFVWTQLKNNEIISKQSLMIDSGIEELDAVKYCSNLASIVTKKSKILNLFHPSCNKRFHQQLSESESSLYLRTMNPPNVVHNHFSSAFNVGNKNALFHNLVAYYEYLEEDVKEIVPLTYYVTGVNSKSFREFQKIAESEQSIWIIKPGQNSNRGKGIFVSSKATDIKKKLQNKKTKKHTYIIQKYITNLFLFHKRKFDIRTYLLMVTIAGVTKFYWYSEGYIRTSSQIYDLSDLNDLFIHLTNDAIQVNSQAYGKYEKGNKITYNEFQRYLDSNFAQQKYAMSSLVQNMKQIATKAVKATYFKIDPKKIEYGFELFGMDFIVDSNFRPWLLQINTNPCLELSSPSLQRLIPRMMQNLFRVAVDPVLRPNEEIPKNLAYYIYQNSIETNRFELIFDSLFDRDLHWEEVSTRSAEIIYQDDNEIFENDGQIINIDF